MYVCSELKCYVSGRQSIQQVVQQTYKRRGCCVVGLLHPAGAETIFHTPGARMQNANRSRHAASGWGKGAKGWAIPDQGYSEILKYLHVRTPTLCANYCVHVKVEG